MKSINKKKEAKFFCESCGAEVKQNARVCTYCGKFFSSVRCPKCGKTGTNDDFKKGCPACGYAVIPGTKLFSNSSDFSFNSKKKLFNNSIKNINKKENNESLPLWIYIICILALVLVLIGVYSCL